MVSVAGIGSGVDVESIISQLIAIEEQPLVRLQSQQAALSAEISGFGQLSSALSNLNAQVAIFADVNNFNQFTANSSDTTIFTATADENAAEESHTVEVISLAQAHRLNSSIFADSDTIVGTGTLSLSSGSESFDLTIDSSNQTLAGIRDAINNSADNSSITASIINVDGGSRLILTANSTGLSNAIEVTVTGDGDGNDTDTNGLSQLVYQAAGTQNLTQLDQALDASIEVNGFAVTSASNSVSDVISGVTLNLVAAGTADLSLSRDVAGIEQAANGIATQYNALIATMNELNATFLPNDSFLRGVENSVRNLFYQEVDNTSGDINFSFQLGFSFNKDGVLSFDSSTLSELVESDLEAVSEFFTKEDTGFATQLESLLDSYISTTGLIKGKTDSITSQIESIDDQIESIAFRISKTEERLRAQFTALDVLVGSLSVTSTFLTQQLSLFTSNNN